MSVTELHPDQSGGSYAEGLARAEQLQAEAEAQRIKNEGERVRQELANERARAKAQKDIQRDLDDAAEERRRREETRREEAAAKAKAEKSAATWRKAAKTIAIVCVVVSLPMQVMAFWDPHAWFLVAAPFVLEGVAWALLCGAQAAIDEGRPSWHYRLGALVQALIAAGINLAHGSAEYGIATGIGGALCSVIGPAIWDLHEHGRITKREGRTPRSVRRAERRTARAELLRLDAVNAARAAGDPAAWERAIDLATALGEVRPGRRRSPFGLRRPEGPEVIPSEKTYARACLEIHGAEPGSTADRIAHMRAAKRAVRLAQNGPLDAPEKDAKPQVDSQTPPAADEPSTARVQASKKPGEDGRKRNGGTPPRRRPGTVKYHPAARRQMAVTASRPTD
ncbi:hypothetical protein HW130_17290 [Streptomyces sp. PKU-EA00015]|uniref:hypothetical protein n=1 Tax=Streptomyces sp. PKU-EA00015 TaxID=2748326 RepID=UPI0015A405D9|nr:hypothetical protein [Streptomyces sp. PKU-EA00015]NWF27999.1 hypothetical protein [Streptomyces sp. PKU-EA00015]